MQFVLMAVSILIILLALSAQWLGIDKNTVWGDKRILLMIFGLALFGYATLLHLWRTNRISAEVKQKITAAGQKIQNELSRFIHRLTAYQPLALILSILVVILIAGYGIWYTSLGHFTVFPHVTNDYVDLGESFLHGKLSLLQKPDPRLAALPNPYDRTQRSPILNTDLSYFKGKFYLYWGPTPAILFSIIEWVFRSRPPDQLVVLISYSGLAILLLVLLYSIRKRYYPNAPGISIPFFLMAALVNIPYLFLIGRPQDYENSIITGQFFLILGVLAWFLYQTKTKYLWLVLAGLFWGLAGASPFDLAVSVAVFSIFVLFSSYRNEQVNSGLQSDENHSSKRHLSIDWKAITALFIPLAMCGFALAIYNYVRFGSPLETGYKYQLTLFDPRNPIYSIVYIPSNLFVYLAYPLKLYGGFPFFKSVPIQLNLLPGWATVPRGKGFDQVFFGMFQSLPLLWSLALLLPLTVIGWVKRRHGKTLDDRPDQAQPRGRFLAMLLIASGLQFIFLLLFFYSAMRYICDFFLPLLLGVALLIWTFDQQIRHIPLLRWAFWLVIIGLAIASSGIGFFAGFDIPPQYIRSENLHLFGALSAFWNHPYNQLVALIGEPAALARAVARITTRVLGKFSR